MSKPKCSARRATVPAAPGDSSPNSSARTGSTEASGSRISSGSRGRACLSLSRTSPGLCTSTKLTQHLHASFFIRCIYRSCGERRGGGTGGTPPARGPPRARAVLSARGRTCRCSDASRSSRHRTTRRNLWDRQAGGWRGPRRGRAPAVPTATLQGDGTCRRMEAGECRPSPGAGGGCGERALTALMGQHGAAPPVGTVPRHLTGGTVVRPIRPLPGLALCRARGVQRHGPAVPQPPITPAAHTSPLYSFGVQSRWAAHAGSRRQFSAGWLPRGHSPPRPGGRLSGRPGTNSAGRGVCARVPQGDEESLLPCVPRWAYLSLVPGPGHGEVVEAAELVVGPAIGAVVYVPAVCLGRAVGGHEDRRHHCLEKSVAPSWPSYKSSCPPSRGTHRLAAGAPRSPAAGGRVWLMPPSFLLPIKAREGHTRSLGDRGSPYYLCPESANLPGCGLSLAPLSRLEEVTGCSSLSAPRHRSLPHACTPCPRHGLESPTHTGSRSSWPHQSQTRQEAFGRAALLCGDTGRRTPARQWHRWGCRHCVHGGIFTPRARSAAQTGEGNQPHQRSSLLSGLIPGHWSRFADSAHLPIKEAATKVNAGLKNAASQPAPSSKGRAQPWGCRAPVYPWASSEHPEAPAAL